MHPLWIMLAIVGGTYAVAHLAVLAGERWTSGRFRARVASHKSRQCALCKRIKISTR